MSSIRFVFISVRWWLNQKGALFLNREWTRIDANEFYSIRAN
jgi:hypothetical protein